MCLRDVYQNITNLQTKRKFGIIQIHSTRSTDTAVKVVVTTKYVIPNIWWAFLVCFCRKFNDNLHQKPLVQATRPDRQYIAFQVVPDIQAFKSEVCLEDSENDFALPIPKCYYAHYSPGESEPELIPPSSALVLENIKPQGFQSVNFAIGLDLNQARAAIEAIAKVHSLSLCLKVSLDIF